MNNTERLFPQMCSSSSHLGRFTNVDEVQEILVRLPIKDVIRSKSVCKSWNTLICSPEFAKLYQHHQRHKDDNPLLHIFVICNTFRRNFRSLYTFKIESCDVDAINKEYWLYRLEKPAEKLEHKFNLENFPIGSCNGLICFPVDSGYETICLWNPATREYHHVQGPRLPEHWVSLYWGFGYDSISDDYKILLLGKEPTNVPFARIFTLRSNKWRRLVCPSDDSQISAFFKKTKLPPRPVLAGDTLYWWMEDINPDNLLLAFNIPQESFEIVRLPNPREQHCVAFFICQIRQSLCACWVYNELAENDSRGPWLYIEGWILEHEHWKFLLKLRGLERFSARLKLPHRPMLFELKEQGKFLLTDSNFRGGVIFDPRGQLHYPPRCVQLDSIFGRSDVPTVIFDYTPSLVSPIHHLTVKSI